jgi:hypothetical protein
VLGETTIKFGGKMLNDTNFKFSICKFDSSEATVGHSHHQEEENMILYCKDSVYTYDELTGNNTFSGFSLH